MSVDVSQVGILAAELMDDLADEYGAEFGVCAVMLVVELDNDEANIIRYRCNDARRWVQHGLLEAGKRAVDYNFDAEDVEDGDE